MQKNIQKAFTKIIKEFSGLHRMTKKMIFLGLNLSLLTIIGGTALMVVNRTLISFNPYFDYVSMEIVNKGFAIFAEVIIGCILIDFLFRR